MTSKERKESVSMNSVRDNSNRVEASSSSKDLEGLTSTISSVNSLVAAQVVLNSTSEVVDLISNVNSSRNLRR
jgi:hypothetical protein